MTNIVLFEDKKYLDFQPLSKTRPLHFLRCGAKFLFEKYFDRLDNCVFHFLHRSEFNYLQQNLPAPFSADSSVLKSGFVAINVRILPDETFINHIKKLIDSSENVTYGNETDGLLFGRFSDLTDLQNQLNSEIDPLKITDHQSGSLNILNFPWDLVNNNGKEIIADSIYLQKVLPSAENKQFDHAVLVNQAKIFIANSATLQAGVIIDATKGPVIIDENVNIMHNSVIIGPCFIGCNSTIKISSKIYENCSFGPFCKVGGEVEGSIIHAYSNKQHDGFLGHAYLGEWCNLGADTNNSDLKNNYSSVTVMINGRLVDSGSMFVGLFMGDHAKSAINTMFNTGTVVGVCCNVFGEGFPERNIPDFHWGGKGKTIKYPFKRTIETVEIVKNRRKQQLATEEIQVLKSIFDNSK